MTDDEMYQAYLDALNLQAKLGNNAPPFINIFLAILKSRQANNDVKPTRKTNKIESPK